MSITNLPEDMIYEISTQLENDNFLTLMQTCTSFKKRVIE